MLALTLLAIVGFRKTRAVFFQGPSLLITMLLGSMMISGTLILTTVEQSASICAWRLFLSSMGFSLIFATLLGKLYRYNKIFYNKSALTVKVTNVHIVSGTLIFLAVDAILCGIWIGVSPMKIASEAPNTCSDSLTATGISTVLLIVKGVILVGSVWLYRNLQALEGRTASMFKSDINMTGQISALSLLFLAILLLVNEVSTSTVFQRTILLIQCIAALFVSVVPYVWYACVKVVFLLDDRKARKSSHVSEAIASTNMAAKGYTSTKKTKGDTKVAGGTSVQLGDSTSESATAGDAADTKGLQSDVSKNFRIKLDEVQKALTEYNMYDQLAQKSSAKFNKLKSELLQMEAEMDFRNQ
ncbi:hypothetical protein PBRA_002165 [Plasmodiophora brassicae]|uniref:G-protein coupled receptors family 3 profile domain-containing protein n=1 Tax=Plasmodiophora brassicae TaxID=37360 RepID=A0A0G4J2G5_PLABS|nr:hypothetical protein PBRA_002165 [Plasmodiophora brassicae]